MSQQLPVPQGWWPSGNPVILSRGRLGMGWGTQENPQGTPKLVPPILHSLQGKPSCHWVTEWFRPHNQRKSGVQGAATSSCPTWRGDNAETSESSPGNLEGCTHSEPVCATAFVCENIAGGCTRVRRDFSPGENKNRHGSLGVRGGCRVTASKQRLSLLAGFI